jgi:tetratricopeptide (TPR) repeat protein
MAGARNLKTTVAAIFMALLLGGCARDPQKAKAKYLAEGQKNMKEGQYGDARIEFRNALRLDPRFVEAYYQLAQADLAQRDWQGAYASLEKVIELDPGRLDARLDRGRLYLAARQFDKAEEEANAILQKEPKSVGAYQILGAAMMGEQKPDEALAAFSRVTELLPNNPSAYVNIALVEITLHQFAPAERHLKKAIAVDPKALPTVSRKPSKFCKTQLRTTPIKPHSILILHQCWPAKARKMRPRLFSINYAKNFQTLLMFPSPSATSISRGKRLTRR